MFGETQLSCQVGCVCMYINTYIDASVISIIQSGSGTEPRTAKRTENIGTEPEPFIFTNRTEPVGNLTVWAANSKHEPVANRLRIGCKWGLMGVDGAWCSGLRPPLMRLHWSLGWSSHRVPWRNGDFTNIGLFIGYPLLSWHSHGTY